MYNKVLSKATFVLTIASLATMIMTIQVYAQGPEWESHTPLTNTTSAPLTTTIAITYNQPMNAATITSHTFAIHGMQSGLVTATHGLLADGYTFIVTPTRPFHQGELVYAVATTHTTNITGTAPLASVQWQFNAGDVSRRCVAGFTEVYSSSLTGVLDGNGTWGDYDKDGDLDILLTGESSGGVPIAKIYQNTGSGFSEVHDGDLTGVRLSSAAWGDYDGDGDLDILLTGDSGGLVRTSKIYQNTGSGFSEVYTGSLTDVFNSSAAWGDYDNDGDLDILLTGDDGVTSVSKIYQNTGSGFSEVYPGSLSGTSVSSVAWGDYDNDGDLDILFTDGKVYQNRGNGFSQVMSNSFTSLTHSSGAWGDYDNDGDLDILLTGYEASTSTTKIYQNTSSSFNEVYSGSLTDIANGSAAWGDYDNDGDLDILLTGHDDITATTKVYQNTGNGFNEVYSGSLMGVYDSSGAWGDYDDDGDLDILLTGYDGGDHYIAKLYRNDDCPLSPLASVVITGPTTGILSTTYTFTATVNPTATLPFTYEWHINESANERTLIHHVSRITDTAMISWTTAGEQTITVTVTNAAGIVSEAHMLTVPYLETFTDSGITTLTKVEYDPDAAWGDYDNDGDLDIVLSGCKDWDYDTPTCLAPITQLYRNDGGNFVLVSDTPFPGATESQLAWGDYDADNDLDLLFSGCTAWTTGPSCAQGFTHLYRNLGSGSFITVTTAAFDAGEQATWGDYDNDGDLDLAFAHGVVYRNIGNGYFDKQSSLPFPHLDTGSADWGDYDNDGDLDLLLTGGGTTTVAKLYQNDGHGNFTEVTSVDLAGVAHSDTAWGDYDNDGDLDILLAGFSTDGSTRITKVYRNDGSTFAEIGSALPGVNSTSLAWGDYDNDGDLDIVLAGDADGGALTHVYRNLGSDVFELVTTDLPAHDGGKVTWGDYDNDGDLDLLMVGDVRTDDEPPVIIPSAQIYHNLTLQANTPPTAPTGLRAVTLTQGVLLSWSTAHDEATPDAGLSYNLRVGSTPGGSDIVAPHALTTGQRMLPTLGNVQHGLTATLLITEPGDYYWSVQAIDTAFAGSPWAKEQSFTLKAVTCPTPLTDAEVTGPTTGVTDTLYSFTGSITPTNATAPITYTWTPAPLIGQGSLAASYRWATPGTYTVTLTAHNCGGTVMATQTISISAGQAGTCPYPLTAITLDGEATSEAGHDYTINALTVPPDATEPVAFAWLPEPTKGQGTANATYRWPVSGTYTITVSAANCGDIVSATHAVTVTPPVAGCDQPLTSVAVVGPSQGYTATLYTLEASPTPADATLPITYTWAPTPQSGQTLAQATYQWSSPGTYTVTLAAQNCGGTVTTTHTIMISDTPSPGDAYEPDNTCQAAQPIATDGSLQVRTLHQSDDVDWAAFEAQAGTEYVILASTTADSTADVALAVYDTCDDGDPERQNHTFSPDVRLRFTAPHDGDYYLKLNNAFLDTGENPTYQLSVRALESAPTPGALVLVAGRLKDKDPVQDNIYAVTNGVYKLFRGHGYTGERIYYLAPEAQDADNDKQNDVDVAPAMASDLETALTQWTLDKVSADRALTVYLMDHGGVDRFYVNGSSQTVSPVDLDNWLDQVEAAVPDVRVNVIMEACHSGSFVSQLSKPGRVVMASTGTWAVAYATQSGAFFSDVFLKTINLGDSLFGAFSEASWRLKEAHPDQTPWLDDDGDGVPNGPLDGQVAAQRGFAYAGTFDPTQEQWPPYIVWGQVEATHAGPSTIRAEVRDDTGVFSVWAVVYKPSYVPPDPTATETLLEETLATVTLLDSDSDGTYTASTLEFNEVGEYDVVIYATDVENLDGRPQKVTVSAGGTTAEPDGTDTHLPIVTDDAYTITVDIPASALTATTTFTYTDVTSMTTAPPDWIFAGRGFNLTAYQYGTAQTGFTFQQPITITVHYNDADVEGLDEATLALWWLDEDMWSQDGLGVIERDLINNQLVVTTNHLTQFALFGEEEAPSYAVYLPVVLRK